MKIVFIVLSLALNVPVHGKIVNFYIHGLTGNKEGIKYYANFFNPDEENITPEYPDSTPTDSNVLYKIMRARASSLAQGWEITHLYENIKPYQSEKKFGIGVSRSASVLIVYCATHTELPMDGIIAESAFSYAQDVAQTLSPSWTPDSVKKQWGRFLTYHVFPHFYNNYNPYGTHPIDAIKNIPHETAILFVCSKEDTLIPASSTIALYKEAVKAGHPKTHLLILEKGYHAELLAGADRQIYEEVARAFKQKYGLSHNQIQDNNMHMHEILSKTQPTLQELECAGY